MAILTGVRWNLSVVLTWLSFMARQVFCKTTFTCRMISYSILSENGGVNVLKVLFVVWDFISLIIIVVLFPTLCRFLFDHLKLKYNYFPEV
jgi:hypothetical protein